MAGVEEVARAIAYFAACSDAILLRRLLAEIAPRARRLIDEQVRAAGEDSVPGPADVLPAPTPASRDEALRTLAATGDLALLQAMSRTIGRRLEALRSANGPAALG